MRTLARILMVFIALVLIGGALFLVVINFNLIPGLDDAVILPAWAGENVIIVGIAILALIALILLALVLNRLEKQLMQY